jgi:hypothetical protein
MCLCTGFNFFHFNLGVPLGLSAKTAQKCRSQMSQLSRSSESGSLMTGARLLELI